MPVHTPVRSGARSFTLHGLFNYGYLYYLADGAMKLNVDSSETGDVSDSHHRGAVVPDAAMLCELQNR